MVSHLSFPFSFVMTFSVDIVNFLFRCKHLGLWEKFSFLEEVGTFFQALTLIPFNRYLQQVSQWIRFSQPFFEKCVAPAAYGLYGKSASSSFPGHTAFCLALLNLVNKKLKNDLPLIIDDDVNLSHLIDEVLFFCKEVIPKNLNTSLPKLLLRSFGICHCWKWYSGVLLKWEFFIKMRATCFAPSFLQKRRVLEWGWQQVGSSHFNEKFSL